MKFIVWLIRVLVFVLLLVLALSNTQTATDRKSTRLNSSHSS